MCWVVGAGRRQRKKKKVVVSADAKIAEAVLAEMGAELLAVPGFNVDLVLQYCCIGASLFLGQLYLSQAVRSRRRCGRALALRRSED